IEARRKYFNDSQKQINDGLAQIQEMQRRYQRTINSARQKAQALIEKTIREAERVRQEQVGQVLTEGRLQLEAALANLRQEQARTVDQLGQEIEALAGMITDKVLVAAASGGPRAGSLREPEPAGEH
ncbi:MAG: hypothetical protein JOY51_01685, partial [Nevskia sp.]|nr:hypothetical protein [Nevskia sp.]